MLNNFCFQENWKSEEKSLAEKEVFEVLDELKDPGSVQDARPPSRAPVGDKDDRFVRMKVIEDADSDEEGIEDQKGSGHTQQKEPPPTSVPQEEELEVVHAPPRIMPDIRKSEKMILPMTAHAKPGVPARDRPGRAPPHPREHVPAKSHHLEGERDHDETDPVWLKDEADKRMVSGDYQAAYELYTSALSEYSNARCFGNRALAAMYLGNLGQCVEDCKNCFSRTSDIFREPLHRTMHGSVEGASVHPARRTSVDEPRLPPR